jgi:hypothetical protein
LRSRAFALVPLVFALCAGALAIVAASDERELAFTTNVRVVVSVADVRPGQEACERGLDTTAAFDTVELHLASGTEPAPPLDVTARDSRSRSVLARGRVPRGGRDNVPVRARVGPEVPEGRRIDVCLRNAGSRPVGLYGGPDWESPGRAWVGRRRARGDIRIVFLRSEPRSALSLVPEIFERAALFRPEPVGAWTFWLLLVLVAVGVPLLLAAALRAAADPGRAPENPPDRS